MEKLKVPKAPLNWIAAGVLLGAVQILAVGLYKPLGVSTEFVTVDARIIKAVDPEYVQNHPLISSEKYQEFGYGFFLDIGILIGAAVAALIVRRWRLSSTPIWWQANHGSSKIKRFIVCLIGGFLILFGARLAHGCTSGQFASGWAQLALSAIPFTITLFGFGMLTAFIVYRKSPDIDK